MWHTFQAIGNLGRDPEMRYLPSGTAVTSFSIAINKEFTSAGGEREKQTIWARVSVFGKSAEACNQYLKKGSRVLVVGELSPDKATGGPHIWTNAEGNPQASYEITASTVRFLSSKPSEQHEQMQGAEVPPEDDIPF